MSADDEISTAIISAANSPVSSGNGRTLAELYTLVSAAGVADTLDALSVLSALLPNKDPAARDLVGLVGECSPAKEVMMAAQEEVEKVAERAGDEEDDERTGEAANDVAKTTWAERLTELLDIYRAVIPRLKLRKRSASDILRPLLSDLKRALEAVSYQAEQEESWNLLAAVEMMVNRVWRWAKDLPAVESEEVTKCQLELKSVLDHALVLFRSSLQYETAQKALELCFPRLKMSRPTESSVAEQNSSILEACSATYDDLGLTRNGYASSPSLVSVILLVRVWLIPSKPTLKSIPSSFLPSLLTMLQPNSNLQADALAFLLLVLHQGIEVSPDITSALMPQMIVLSSAHPSSSTRHQAFRAMSLLLAKSPPQLRMQILADLVANSEYPQMRVAAVGLVKEAVLEALDSRFSKYVSPFVTPMFMTVFGPLLFRPSPSDLFDQSVKMDLEEFLESPEPKRITEALSLYYVVLLRDGANMTGIRDKDMLEAVNKNLLHPLESWLGTLMDKKDQGGHEHTMMPPVIRVSSKSKELEHHRPSHYPQRNTGSSPSRIDEKLAGPKLLTSGSDDVARNIDKMSSEGKLASSETSVPTDAAAQDLKKLGYNQEMTRNRGLAHILFMTLGLFIIHMLYLTRAWLTWLQYVAIMAVPFGLAAPIATSLIGGGPSVMIWGLAIVSVFCQALALSLAEICSKYPTSAGAYYWTYRLAPTRSRLLWSWINGWLTMVGVWTISLSVNFGTAQLVVAGAGIYNPDWVATAWQTYLIFLAVTVFSTGFGIFFNTLLPAVDAASGRRPASFALGFFDPSASGWAAGWSFFIGLLPPGEVFHPHDCWIEAHACLTPAAYTYSALGMIASMCEEVRNPTKEVPQALAWSIPIGFLTGLVFLLPVVFTLPDIVPSGQPIGVLFTAVMGSRGGGFGMWFILFMIGIFCAISICCAASRATWSFARDKAIPYYIFFGKVNHGFLEGVPLNAYLLSTMVQVLLGLIFLGSSTAFNAFVGVAVICLGASYAMPVFLAVLDRRRQMVDAPYNLGRWGYIINWLAVLWVLFEIVLFCMPAVVPVTSSSMNYASVVFVGFALFSGVWYVIDGKHHYSGPPIPGDSLAIEEHPMPMKDG
ncbi:hypothetical protein NP233_g5935 [Leucocoprinus birnbaumii]|uniref:Uncharacterized protein n=1 Tax=Leucocoprinus birnbaumii TaxID=56174 RepID=A0AAD5VRZ2_9AGAR|nr:hypothetical protein NP233_g5935 [Leucocoprinus birnbaumii]